VLAVTPPPATTLRVMVNRALLWAKAVLETSKSNKRIFMLVTQ
jgi:hypothetical protein